MLLIFVTDFLLCCTSFSAVSSLVASRSSMPACCDIGQQCVARRAVTQRPGFRRRLSSRRAEAHDKVVDGVIVVVVRSMSSRQPLVVKLCRLLSTRPCMHNACLYVLPWTATSVDSEGLVLSDPLGSR